MACCACWISLVGGSSAQPTVTHAQMMTTVTEHQRRPIDMALKYTNCCSTMKELSPGDRPREKLVRHGAHALGDNELVAVLVGSGCRGRDALAVANELLAARGGLHGLSRSTADQLRRASGIGLVKASQIVAAI